MSNIKNKTKSFEKSMELIKDNKINEANMYFSNAIAGNESNWNWVITYSKAIINWYNSANNISLEEKNNFISNLYNFLNGMLIHINYENIEEWKALMEKVNKHYEETENDFVNVSNEIDVDSEEDNIEGDIDKLLEVEFKEDINIVQKEINEMYGIIETVDINLIEENKRKRMNGWLEKRELYVKIYQQLEKIDESFSQVGLKLTFNDIEDASIFIDKKMYVKRNLDADEIEYDADEDLLDDDVFRSYDENSNIISKRIYNKDCESLENWDYKYDDKSNIVKKTLSNKDYKFLLEWRYEYNENGNMVKKAKYNYGEILLDDWRYEYDENGNMIRSFQYDKYDENGNIIRSFQCDKGEVAGSLINEYHYEYDSNNNVIEYQQYDGNMKLVRKYESIFLSLDIFYRINIQSIEKLKYIENLFNNIDELKVQYPFELQIYSRFSEQKNKLIGVKNAYDNSIIDYIKRVYAISNN